jgi:plastocyanin
MNVDSSGNFSPTSLTLNVGDTINFIYTNPGNENIVQFSPSSISSFTVDQEITSKTRTFSSAGSWTAKVKDKSGNTLSITVQ